MINVTYEILQPFGITKRYLEDSVKKERQYKIIEFYHNGTLTLPPGFEPGSKPPQGPMISNYTMGAYKKSY
jgi:hypothetical protein